MNSYSPYIEFNRKEWAELKEHQTTLPLTEAELEQLKGLNEEVSIQEVEDIYLPLTHFIDLYARVSRELNRLTASFMKKSSPHPLHHWNRGKCCRGQKYSGPLAPGTARQR